MVIPAMDFTIALPGGGNVVFVELLQDVTIGVSATTRATINYSLLAIGSVYVLGMGITGWRMLANLRQLRRMIHKGEHHKPKGKRFTVVQSQERQPVFSFMNYLFVDAGQATPNEVLYHEEVHIRQLHSIDVLWFELLTVLFWFNPVLWLYRRAIALTHEYIADKATMQHTGARQYASLLARNTLQQMQTPMVHHFGHAPVMKRIQMIINKQKPTPMLKFIAPIVLLLVAAVGFGCETVAPASDAVVEDQPREVIDAMHSKQGPDKDGVYVEVDQAPKPEGGLKVLYGHIINNMKYPKQARKVGVEGKVYVQFVITPEGKLTDAKVIKGIGAGCDAEALRVVQEANLAWVPGVHEGKKVSVRLTLPISFALGNDDEGK